MKYLSVDLETTGLDHTKHSVIEFAAILADTNNGGEIKGAFRGHIFPENMVWDSYCLRLHREWLDWILNIPQAKWAENLIYSDMVQLMGAFAAWRETYGLEKSVSVAGKNFGTFDSRFLMGNYCDRWYKRRIIDVGTMYREKGDDVLPDLETCKRRSGLFESNRVAHDALSDAMDVVKLVNHKW